MMIYVAHAYGGKKDNFDHAKEITNRLQKRDLQNCYICPLLTFSHLDYKEIGYEEEMELCVDLLSVCDVLLVASTVSHGVAKEIEFAKLVGMEVRYLDEV